MLVNKDAYQRETLTKWPVRLSLKYGPPLAYSRTVCLLGAGYVQWRKTKLKRRRQLAEMDGLHLPSEAVQGGAVDKLLWQSIPEPNTIWWKMSAGRWQF